jgi:hypothetical protein
MSKVRKFDDVIHLTNLHIRLSKQSRFQLDTLSDRFGTTLEGTVNLALDRLFRDLSMMDDLKEVLKKGIKIDGRCTIIELGCDQDTSQEESDHDR